MSHPKFVVVGHPNKGKSSIVSTLTLDDSVVISDKPGTTTKSRSFKLKSGEKTLYELIDTPGFQRPRKLLKILQKGNPSAIERPQRVLEFLDAYCSDNSFRDECELLRPIMSGGGIIYVVDASKPYSPEFESEMEILRYCGRGSMAILNYIGDSDYTKEWDAILGQYFRIIKPFNPLKATFKDHIDLLEALKHIDPNWGKNLDEAITLLKEFHQEQKIQIATLITDTIEDILSFQLQKSSALFNFSNEKLIAEFKETIEKKEQKLFSDIKDILNFKNSDIGVENIKVEYNLFSKEAYEIFGLSKDRLTLISTLTSATAGGLIDLAVGGHSFFLGTVIGAAAGYFGANYGYEELSKVKLLSNKVAQVGPIEDQNFGFILLNRALNYANALLNRSHANREKERILPINDDLSIKNLKKISSIHKKFRDNRADEKDKAQYKEIILTHLM